MKRKLAWVCLLVSPLVIGGVVLVLLPRDPITQAHCDKIKPGMTVKEVQAILGRKYDDSWTLSNSNSSVFYFIFEWRGSRGAICVEAQKIHQGNPFPQEQDFEKASVHKTDFVPREPETIIEKIKSWLNL
jgi:hypothetical protein